MISHGGPSENASPFVLRNPLGKCPHTREAHPATSIRTFRRNTMRLMSRAAFAFAAVLIAAPALSAQTSFSIAAGAAAPIGSTADGLKLGYNATVGLGIKPPVAPLGLRFEAGLNQMDFKTDGLGSARLISGSAN